MNFDQALEELGEFGLFQIYNYILFCLPVFFSAGNSLTYVFTAGIPKYRCLVPECENIQTAKYKEPWLEGVLPAAKGNHTKYSPAQCSRYEPKNMSEEIQCIKYHFTKKIIECDSWVYEDDEWTIVGEWDITCDYNLWKLSLVGTVHFVGILFGTMIFGYLADRYGRKSVFVFCILLMSLTGIAQALSPNYEVFQVFVFINALGTSGVYPLAFILGVELVGRRKREMSGVILNYFYALGEAFIALIASYSKNWVILQLAVSLPPILFVFYYWLIPESVRWLLANNKIKKASKIIKKAARVNKKQLSRELLLSMEVKEEDRIIDAPRKKKFKIWHDFKQLAKSKKLCFRSVLLFYIWAANAMVYYGLSVNSTSLAGSKYLNFALVCLIEIPGYTLSWISMNRLGRRWSLFCSLLLCSVTCVSVTFIPEGFPGLEAIVVALFLLGKLGITSAFGIAYVHTAELYPTTLRSIGVGAASTMARLGAVVAPFAPLLSLKNPSLPMLLFSGASLIGCILSLILPETLGVKLPDTVEEAEKIHIENKNKKTPENS